MGSRAFLIPGLDLSALPSDATNDQIQQSMTYASPETDLGMVIDSIVAPDVAAHSEYSTFLWLEKSTESLYYYDGASWQAIKASAIITSGSIPLTALDVTGHTANYVVCVNGGGTEFITRDVSTMFAANSFAVANLVKSAVGNAVLATNAGSISWVPYAGMWSYLLGSNVVPIANIAKGAAVARGSFLYTNAAGTTLTYAQFDPDAHIADGTLPADKLAVGSAGQVLTTVGGVAVWASASPASAGKFTQEYAVSSIAVPASGVEIAALTHGLTVSGVATRPKLVQWELRCATAFGPFALGDVITHIVDSNGQEPFRLLYNATTIRLVHKVQTGGPPDAYNTPCPVAGTYGGVPYILGQDFPITAAEIANFVLDIKAWL